MIGAGDILDSVVEKEVVVDDGDDNSHPTTKLVKDWACTAVADSHDVTVFEVSRSLVERVLGSKTAHPEEMIALRQEHRGRILQV